MKTEQRFFVLAGANMAGTECRQMVAHGASRGYGVGRISSPGGAKEFSRLDLSFGHRTLFMGQCLSPLPGLGWFGSLDPRLAPWATICRHAVALE